MSGTGLLCLEAMQQGVCASFAVQFSPVHALTGAWGFMPGCNTQGRMYVCAPGVCVRTQCLNESVLSMQQRVLQLQLWFGWVWAVLAGLVGFAQPFTFGDMRPALEVALGQDTDRSACCGIAEVERQIYAGCTSWRAPDSLQL